MVLRVKAGTKFSSRSGVCRIKWLEIRESHKVALNMGGV